VNILVDTNILTRSAQPDHPQHPQARDAVKLLLERGDTLRLVPQNFYEFWAVATRPPEQNGLNWTTMATEAELAKLERLFEPLSSQAGTFSDKAEPLPTWRALALRYDAKGKNAHDTRLVAAMNLFSVSHLLTFNKKDFVRFVGITVLTPEEVLASSQAPKNET
jgi:predicted nucleic acid-binding protein